MHELRWAYMPVVRATVTRPLSGMQALSGWTGAGKPEVQTRRECKAGGRSNAAFKSCLTRIQVPIAGLTEPTQVFVSESGWLL